jgi:hypothetical protein
MLRGCCGRYIHRIAAAHQSVGADRVSLIAEYSGSALVDVPLASGCRRGWVAHEIKHDGIRTSCAATPGLEDISVYIAGRMKVLFSRNFQFLKQRTSDRLAPYAFAM